MEKEVVSFFLKILAQEKLINYDALFDLFLEKGHSSLVDRFKKYNALQKYNFFNCRESCFFLYKGFVFEKLACIDIDTYQKIYSAAAFLLNCYEPLHYLELKHCILHAFGYLKIKLSVLCEEAQSSLFKSIPFTEEDREGYYVLVDDYRRFQSFYISTEEKTVLCIVGTLMFYKNVHFEKLFEEMESRMPIEERGCIFKASTSRQFNYMKEHYPTISISVDGYVTLTNNFIFPTCSYETAEEKCSLKSAELSSQNNVIKPAQYRSKIVTDPEVQPNQMSLPNQKSEPDQELDISCLQKLIKRFTCGLYCLLKYFKFFNKEKVVRLALLVLEDVENYLFHVPLLERCYFLEDCFKYFTILENDMIALKTSICDDTLLSEEEKDSFLLVYILNVSGVAYYHKIFDKFLEQDRIMPYGIISDSDKFQYFKSRPHLYYIHQSGVVTLSDLPSIDLNLSCFLKSNQLLKQKTSAPDNFKWTRTDWTELNSVNDYQESSFFQAEESIIENSHLKKKLTIDLVSPACNEKNCQPFNNNTSSIKSDCIGSLGLDLKLHDNQQMIEHFEEGISTTQATNLKRTKRKDLKLLTGEENRQFFRKGASVIQTFNLSGIPSAELDLTTDSKTTDETFVKEKLLPEISTLNEIPKTYVNFPADDKNSPFFKRDTMFIENPDTCVNSAINHEDLKGAVSIGKNSDFVGNLDVDSSSFANKGKSSPISNKEISVFQTSHLVGSPDLKLNPTLDNNIQELSENGTPTTEVFNLNKTMCMHLSSLKVDEETDQTFEGEQPLTKTPNLKKTFGTHERRETHATKISDSNKTESIDLSSLSVDEVTDQTFEGEVPVLAISNLKKISNLRESTYTEVSSSNIAMSIDMSSFSADAETSQNVEGEESLVRKEEEASDFKEISGLNEKSKTFTVKVSNSNKIMSIDLSSLSVDEVLVTETSNVKETTDSCEKRETTSAKVFNFHKTKRKDLSSLSVDEKTSQISESHQSVTENSNSKETAGPWEQIERTTTEISNLNKNKSIDLNSPLLDAEASPTFPGEESLTETSNLKETVDTCEPREMTSTEVSNLSNTIKIDLSPLSADGETSQTAEGDGSVTETSNLKETFDTNKTLTSKVSNLDKTMIIDLSSPLVDRETSQIFEEELSVTEVSNLKKITSTYESRETSSTEVSGLNKTLSRDMSSLPHEETSQTFEKEESITKTSNLKEILIKSKRREMPTAKVSDLNKPLSIDLSSLSVEEESSQTFEREVPVSEISDLKETTGTCERQEMPTFEVPDLNKIMSIDLSLLSVDEKINQTFEGELPLTETSNLKETSGTCSTVDDEKGQFLNQDISTVETLNLVEAQDKNKQDRILIFQAKILVNETPNFIEASSTELNSLADDEICSQVSKEGLITKVLDSSVDGILRTDYISLPNEKEINQLSIERQSSVETSYFIGTDINSPGVKDLNSQHFKLETSDADTLEFEGTPDVQLSLLTHSENRSHLITPETSNSNIFDSTAIQCSGDYSSLGDNEESCNHENHISVMEASYQSGILVTDFDSLIDERSCKHIGNKAKVFEASNSSITSDLDLKSVTEWNENGKQINLEVPPKIEHFYISTTSLKSVSLTEKISQDLGSETLVSETDEVCKVLNRTSDSVKKDNISKLGNWDILKLDKSYYSGLNNNETFENTQNSIVLENENMEEDEKIEDLLINEQIFKLLQNSIAFLLKYFDLPVNCFFFEAIIHALIDVRIHFNELLCSDKKELILKYFSMCTSELQNLLKLPILLKKVDLNKEEKASLFITFILIEKGKIQFRDLCKLVRRMEDKPVTLSTNSGLYSFLKKCKDIFVFDQTEWVYLEALQMFDGHLRIDYSNFLSFIQLDYSKILVRNLNCDCREYRRLCAAVNLLLHYFNVLHYSELKACIFYVLKDIEIHLCEFDEETQVTVFKCIPFTTTEKNLFRLVKSSNIKLGFLTSSERFLLFVSCILGFHNKIHFIELLKKYEEKHVEDTASSLSHLTISDQVKYLNSLNPCILLDDHCWVRMPEDFKFPKFEFESNLSIQSYDERCRNVHWKCPRKRWDKNCRFSQTNILDSSISNLDFRCTLKKITKKVTSSIAHLLEYFHEKSFTHLLTVIFLVLDDLEWEFSSLSVANQARILKECACLFYIGDDGKIILYSPGSLELSDLTEAEKDLLLISFIISTAGEIHYRKVFKKYFELQGYFPRNLGMDSNQYSYLSDRSRIFITHRNGYFKLRNLPFSIDSEAFHAVELKAMPKQTKRIDPGININNSNLLEIANEVRDAQDSIYSNIDCAACLVSNLEFKIHTLSEKITENQLVSYFKRMKSGIFYLSTVLKLSLTPHLFSCVAHVLADVKNVIAEMSPLDRCITLNIAVFCNGDSKRNWDNYFYKVSKDLTDDEKNLLCIVALLSKNNKVNYKDIFSQFESSKHLSQNFEVHKDLYNYIEKYHEKFSIDSTGCVTLLLFEEINFHHVCDTTAESIDMHRGFSEKSVSVITLAGNNTLENDPSQTEFIQKLQTTLVFRDQLEKILSEMKTLDKAFIARCKTVIQEIVAAQIRSGIIYVSECFEHIIYPFLLSLVIHVFHDSETYITSLPSIEKFNLVTKVMYPLTFGEKGEILLNTDKCTKIYTLNSDEKNLLFFTYKLAISNQILLSDLVQVMKEHNYHSPTVLNSKCFDSAYFKKHNQLFHVHENEYVKLAPFSMFGVSYKVFSHNFLLDPEKLRSLLMEDNMCGNSDQDQNFFSKKKNSSHQSNDTPISDQDISDHQSKDASTSDKNISNHQSKDSSASERDNLIKQSERFGLIFSKAFSKIANDTKSSIFSFDHYKLQSENFKIVHEIIRKIHVGVAFLSNCFGSVIKSKPRMVLITLQCLDDVKNYLVSLKSADQKDFINTCLSSLVIKNGAVIFDSNMTIKLNNEEKFRLFGAYLLSFETKVSCEDIYTKFCKETSIEICTLTSVGKYISFKARPDIFVIQHGYVTLNPLFIVDMSNNCRSGNTSKSSDAVFITACGSVSSPLEFTDIKSKSSNIQPELNFEDFRPVVIPSSESSSEKVTSNMPYIFTASGSKTSDNTSCKSVSSSQFCNAIYNSNIPQELNFDDPQYLAAPHLPKNGHFQSPLLIDAAVTIQKEKEIDSSKGAASCGKTFNAIACESESSSQFIDLTNNCLNTVAKSKGDFAKHRPISPVTAPFSQNKHFQPSCKVFKTANPHTERMVQNSKNLSSNRLYFPAEIKYAFKRIAFGLEYLVGLNILPSLRLSKIVVLCLHDVRTLFISLPSQNKSSFVVKCSEMSSKLKNNLPLFEKKEKCLLARSEKQLLCFAYALKQLGRTHYRKLFLQALHLSSDVNYILSDKEMFWYFKERPEIFAINSDGFIKFVPFEFEKYRSKEVPNSQENRLQCKTNLNLSPKDLNPDETSNQLVRNNSWNEKQEECDWVRDEQKNSTGSNGKEKSIRLNNEKNKSIRLSSEEEKSTRMSYEQLKPIKIDHEREKIPRMSYEQEIHNENSPGREIPIGKRHEPEKPTERNCNQIFNKLQKNNTFNGVSEKLISGSFDGTINISQEHKDVTRAKELLPFRKELEKEEYLLKNKSTTDEKRDAAFIEISNAEKISVIDEGVISRYSIIKDEYVQLRIKESACLIYKHFQLALSTNLAVQAIVYVLEDVKALFINSMYVSEIASIPGKKKVESFQSNKCLNDEEKRLLVFTCILLIMEPCHCTKLFEKMRFLNTSFSSDILYNSQAFQYFQDRNNYFLVNSDGCVILKKNFLNLLLGSCPTLKNHSYLLTKASEFSNLLMSGKNYLYSLKFNLNKFERLIIEILDICNQVFIDLSKNDFSANQGRSWLNLYNPYSNYKSPSHQSISRLAKIKKRPSSTVYDLASFVNSEENLQKFSHSTNDHIELSYGENMFAPVRTVTKSSSNPELFRLKSNSALGRNLDIRFPIFSHLNQIELPYDASKSSKTVSISSVNEAIVFDFEEDKAYCDNLINSFLKCSKDDTLPLSDKLDDPKPQAESAIHPSSDLMKVFETSGSETMTTFICDTSFDSSLKSSRNKAVANSLLETDTLVPTSIPTECNLVDEHVAEVDKVHPISVHSTTLELRTLRFFIIILGSNNGVNSSFLLQKLKIASQEVQDYTKAKYSNSIITLFQNYPDVFHISSYTKLVYLRSNVFDK